MRTEVVEQYVTCVYPLEKVIGRIGVYTVVTPPPEPDVRPPDGWALASQLQPPEMGLGIAEGWCRESHVQFSHDVVVLVWRRNVCRVVEE